MFNLKELDTMYIRTCKKVRELALYYNNTDRETITLLVDSIKLNANIELAYYRLAYKYMSTSDLNLFYNDNIKPFKYVLDIDIKKLGKDKKTLTLSQYLKLFNIINEKNTPKELKLNSDIVNYPKSLSSIHNLNEIIIKYGVK